MTAIPASEPATKPYVSSQSAWQRLITDRNWVAFWFMLPAAGFLIVFLAYPLGLGVWMSFTDVRIGRDGVFIGLENYQWLWEDGVFWLSVFNTLLYTIIASAIKFALGLYLALLLNRSMPFKALIRAAVLIRSSCRRFCRRLHSGGSTIRNSRSSPGR
jgi:multiple sugar transport system permease protein